MSFKEIEQLIFPSNWSIQREMRGQILDAFKYQQDVVQIKNIIDKIGQLETDLIDDKLIVFGYK